jgi:hypothetical protein
MATIIAAGRLLWPISRSAKNSEVFRFAQQDAALSSAAGMRFAY